MGGVFLVRPRPMLTGQRLAYNWELGAGVIPNGALVWDLDLKALFVGDGATVGGSLLVSNTKVIQPGKLTPSTLTSVAHDYNPAGVETASLLRMSASGIQTWTGLRAVEGAATQNEPGRVMEVVNVGTSTLVMPGKTGSTAQYQWGWNGILLLEPDMGMRMKFDGDTSLWRLVGATQSYGFSRLVGGGASMLADQPGDTFTFTEGHGIGQVGDDGTDTLAFAAACPIGTRYRSDMYHTSPGTAVGTTDLAISANTIYAAPFYPARTNTWTRIGVNVATAAASQNVRLGVYEEALSGTVPQGQPGTLVFDSGLLSVGSTGFQEVTISQVLRPRHYWLVLVCSGTPTLKALQVGGNPGFGWDASLNRINHLTRAFTFAALPSNEAAASYTLASGSHPAVFLRTV